MEKCKICSGETELIFEANILNKYPNSYFQCKNCDFIQLSNPFWLNEAYQNVITNSDIGILHRNIFLSNIASILISIYFKKGKMFLDFAGGFGIFVRLMRDKGFNFFRNDPFCENIFAKGFEFNGTHSDKFSLTTAFEVFEHFENPQTELEKVLQFGENIFFSTELVPNQKFVSHEQWWYFMPHTGQHISFYTRKSLEILAKKHNLNLYSNNKNVHLFSRKKINRFLFNFLCNRYISLLLAVVLRRRTLTPEDVKLTKL